MPAAAALRRLLRAGDAVFLQTAAAVPAALGAALARVALDGSVRGLSALSLHTEGPAPWLDAAVAPALLSPRLFFVGANARAAVAAGRAAYVPLGLRDVAREVDRGAVRVDAALVTVSPPDAAGLCSLGPAVDVARAALRAARVRVAQVNARAPRLARAGDATVHASMFDALVEADGELPRAPRAAASDAARAIAALVAGLVEDGATLQLGIGGIPDEVARVLASDGHADLGLHSEMLSDGARLLVASGAATGARKKTWRGRAVTAFAVGAGEDFYGWLDGNDGVVFLEAGTTNDPAQIALNPGVVCVNGALAVSLAGDVVADEIGGRVISGPGGQLDFVRGAFAAEGGLSVHALPATTPSGASRIVRAAQGGVVTPRALADVVVTEFGAARLRGASLRERADRLTAIAHPSHRAELDAHARTL